MIVSELGVYYCTRHGRRRCEKCETPTDLTPTYFSRASRPQRVCVNGHRGDRGIDSRGREFCRECRRVGARKAGSMSVGRNMEREGYLPIGPFQDAVTEALRRDPDLTLSGVADRMDWIRHGKGDGTRLAKTLGLAPRLCGRTGVKSLSRWINPETALKLIRAIHVDPWEVGL